MGTFINSLNNEEAIIRQVSKICKSDEFLLDYSLGKLLSFIIAEFIDGNKNSINSVSIAREVFELGDKLDISHIKLVDEKINKLKYALDLYNLTIGKNDELHIDISTNNYFPKFIYNAKLQSIPSDTKKSFEESSVVPKIALLPFKNLSGQKEKDYFAIGFSEELSVELTKYEDLIIYDCLPRVCDIYLEYDVYKFLESKGIRFIIEGSIQIDENKVNILVKLIDRKDGEQIWAESYHKNITAVNIVEIQETIASDISARIGSEYGIIMQKLTSETRGAMTNHLDDYIALLKFYYYQTCHTWEAENKAFNALTLAHFRNPDSAIITALLASMYVNRYMLDLPGGRKSLEVFIELIDEAVRLDSQNLTVNIVLAYKHFVLNDKEQFLKVIDKCLSYKPGSSFRLGIIAMLLTLNGEWERGKGLLDQLEEKNIGCPLYLYGAKVLFYYRQRDFENALKEVNKYKMSALFWGPMLHIAVFGQINKAEDAKPYIDLLLILKPDFKTNAQYLIKMFAKEEELVELIIQGLQKAGLEL